MLNRDSDAVSAIKDELSVLNGRIAALTAERDRLAMELRHQKSVSEEYRDRWRAEEQKVADLRRALERYGHHESSHRDMVPSCDFVNTPDGECTCGLDAAMEDEP